MPRRLSLVLVLVLLTTMFVSPVSARAEAPAPDTVEASVTIEEPALEEDGGERITEPTKAPIHFNSLWLSVSLPIDGVLVRTSLDGESWGAWAELGMVDEDDGPDEGSDEAASVALSPGLASELHWADEAEWFQLRLPGEIDEAQVHLIDSDGLNESVTARLVRTLSPRSAPAQAAGQPGWIRSRSEWGAQPPTSSPRTAGSGVSLTVVHHTATPNDYRPDQVPARMRSMQSYHQGLGWADLGYNIVVDRFGQVWEGRAGGLDRAVIGAHASGFNAGSFGVAVIGNFVNAAPTQASLDSLARVIGWKAAIHGFDPGGTVDFNGALRPVVIGHRDVGRTACPGRIADAFPEIRSAARLHAAPFDDVPLKGTHSESILRLHTAGVINGCGGSFFCPRAQLTRGQAASLIARALELPPGDGSVFSDVVRNSTHEQAIGSVAAAGIVGGYPDGRFGPADPLTREQMASFLARAMGLPGRDGSEFDDVSARSVHGRNVYAIRHAGITGGCSSTSYCPRDNLTREQMASFVDRMMQQRRAAG